MLMKYLILGFCAIAVCLASPTGDCTVKCPPSNLALDRMYQYYNCTPHAADGCPDCVKRYTCPAIIEAPEGHCSSNGLIYKPGDDVPSDNVCKIHCKCTNDGRVSCASVEFCPQITQEQADEGCYLGYAEDKCCPTIMCPMEQKAEPEVKCEFEGKTYRENERFYTGCQRCSCDSGFDPSNPLKSCKPRTCGYDDARLKSGCAIVSGQSSCCPYYYYCPTTKSIRDEICARAMNPGVCHESIPSYYFNATTKTCHAFNYSGCAGGPNRFKTEQECLSFCTGEDVQETPEDGKCYFNGKNYPVSQIVPTEDPYIECKCTKPPYINCLTVN